MPAASGDTPTIHATAVLAGARAVLIRGPAGSGKSSLALRLIQAADAGLLPFARLVGDDRVRLWAAHGRLLVRPAAALAGLLEVRGLGIVRMRFESIAVVAAVIDLGDEATDRLPEPDRRTVRLEGIWLPRLAVAPGADPVGPMLVFLQEVQGSPVAAGGPICVG